ncbi:MAG: hypothetical protein IPO13_07130 [Rhodocyclaceae bacterium]|nr:hypothetical protein [Rhodocyclaceae bacterium]
MDIASFTLSFEGQNSDAHRIEFYDVAQALIGFQRSLALTTHLILNDKIITQSPSLKGARIFAIPAEEGSWKFTAVVSTMLATGAYNLGTAPKETPLGHLVYSLYDYVISESVGVHVDYAKSLGQQYEEVQKRKIKLPLIDQSRADSLVEKCATAVKEMHRPIFMTETATTGSLSGNINGRNLPLQTPLNIQTYEFLQETYSDPATSVILGRVSSYNSNTYKGRIYVEEVGRPVSFELAQNARNAKSLRLITESLSASVLAKDADRGYINCEVVRQLSKSGQLKNYKILRTSAPV